MSGIKEGDIVTRESYRSDIFFRVEKIFRTGNSRFALLRGLDMRLMADAPLEDLKKAKESEWQKKEERVLLEAREYLLGDAKKNLRGNSNEEYGSRPGRVLHLDGDEDYLEKCMARYRELKIEAYGEFLPEAEQPEQILALLKKYFPNLLVITGHDGLVKDRSDDELNLENYYTSSYFVKSVEKARCFERSLDDLIIFAGACQSNYQALIAAGANYASAPKRIMIHNFDPLLVVKALAFTSIGEVVDPGEVIARTISGYRGIGGIETWGCFRLVFPPIKKGG